MNLKKLLNQDNILLELKSEDIRNAVVQAESADQVIETLT